MATVGDLKKVFLEISAFEEKFWDMHSAICYALYEEFDIPKGRLLLSEKEKIKERNRKLRSQNKVGPKTERLFQDLKRFLKKQRFVLK